jgi:hypothetical protein
LSFNIVYEDQRVSVSQPGASAGQHTRRHAHVSLHVNSTELPRRMFTFGVCKQTIISRREQTIISRRANKEAAHREISSSLSLSGQQLNTGVCREDVSKAYTCVCQHTHNTRVHSGSPCVRRCRKSTQKNNTNLLIALQSAQLVFV